MHYKLNEVNIDGKVWYQLEATKEFNTPFGTVKMGDLGGYVADAKVLVCKKGSWIYERSFVHKGVWICDDVVIGEDTVIGENCTIRDDCIIGCRVTIGEGTYIDTCRTIENDCIIGKNAYIDNYGTLASYTIVGDRVDLKSRAGTTYTVIIGDYDGIQGRVFLTNPSKINWGVQRLDHVAMENDQFVKYEKFMVCDSDGDGDNNVIIAFCFPQFKLTVVEDSYYTDFIDTIWAKHDEFISIQASATADSGFAPENLYSHSPEEIRAKCKLKNHKKGWLLSCSDYICSSEILTLSEFEELWREYTTVPDSIKAQIRTLIGTGILHH